MTYMFFIKAGNRFTGVSYSVNLIAHANYVTTVLIVTAILVYFSTIHCYHKLVKTVQFLHSSVCIIHPATSFRVCF